MTSISGWIEIDCYERDYNNKVLKELTYDDEFIKMFCSPEETGNKNASYILFGASINHCNLEYWTERFEEFIKKLKAFRAFVFIDTENIYERVFAIGYELNGKFIKDEITFGESCEYSIRSKDKDEFTFPLIFRVLKKLYNKSHK